MGDEIRLANVIRLSREGLLWRARIGPRDGGLEALAYDRNEAVKMLLAHCDYLLWPWDHGWRDRLE